jgi:hypothetical protein
MAETHHKTRQITSALTDARIQMHSEVARVRRALDMKKRSMESIKKHPWQWTSGAAILGWLLSRIPARKKRIYIHTSTPTPVKSRDERPLDKLWREVWKIFKPLIAAYIAKLIADQTKATQTQRLKLKGKVMAEKAACQN